MNLWWPVEEEWRGVWDGHVRTPIFKMDNQQGLAVGYRELCSMLCGSLDGRGVWGRVDTGTRMAESLCCPPEAITTLLTDCMLYAQSLHLCLTLCSPVDYSPPGSSVHGILQARILEWVALPFFRGSSWPRDRTCISCVSCIAGRFFTHWATWEAC